MVILVAQKKTSTLMLGRHPQNAENVAHKCKIYLWNAHQKQWSHTGHTPSLHGDGLVASGTLDTRTKMREGEGLWNWDFFFEQTLSFGRITSKESEIRFQMLSDSV